MEIFEYVDKGGREANEDYAAHLVIDDDHAVFVVADGMGSMKFGAVASKTVADAVVAEVKLSAKHKTYLTPQQVISYAIEDADGTLERTRLGLGGPEMGTVVAAVYLCGQEAWVASVGDCRVFHYRGRQMLFRSEIDTFLRRSTEAITAKQLRTHTAAVVRALRGDRFIPLGKIDPQSLTVQPGDTLLLCSDGIHKEMDVEKLIDPSDSELQSMLDEQSSCFSDNISLIRVRI